MNKPKHTPIAILGGGITGLTIASLLERAGRDYLLIEGQNEFGGLIKGQQEHGVWLDFGLKSVPVGEDLSTNPLILLKEKLNLGIQIESWTESPKTFSKNGFSEFVGFGETKSRLLVEELEYYTKSPRLLVSGGWKNLTSELLNIIPESKLMSRSIITKIEMQDDKITSILINGEVSLEADSFVLAMAPDSLKNLIPAGKLEGKTLQRIAKSEPWTAVSLDIATEKSVSDAKNIFVFKDSSDENFYVIGQFVSNADPMRQLSNLQLSTWMALVDSESSLDDEVLSKAIKSMRKVIKKVFPEIIDNNTWERLLVVPQALGQFGQLPIEKNLTVFGISNLYMAGAQLKASKRNVKSAIQSALNVGDLLIGDVGHGPR